mmetsp:Transcript_87595/g.169723  ORF Transcript_87595/g.169723 Transcript_87595/m.169723 type:complete len:111 (+) Transcript_87595:491-823(+)
MECFRLMFAKVYFLQHHLNPRPQLLLMVTSLELLPHYRFGISGFATYLTNYLFESPRAVPWMVSKSKASPNPPLVLVMLVPKLKYVVPLYRENESLVTLHPSLATQFPLM